MARNFQDEVIILKFGSRLLADPVLMRDLNDHGDNLIAMEAVKPSDLSSRMMRQPLQPSNVQIPAKSASPVPALMKPNVEAGRRYRSPYSPRSNPLVPSNTPWNNGLGQSPGYRGSPFGHGSDQRTERSSVKSEQDVGKSKEGTPLHQASPPARDQTTPATIKNLPPHPRSGTDLDNQVRNALANALLPPFPALSKRNSLMPERKIEHRYPGIGNCTTVHSIMLPMLT